MDPSVYFVYTTRTPNGTLLGPTTYVLMTRLSLAHTHPLFTCSFYWYAIRIIGGRNGTNGLFPLIVVACNDP